MKQVFQNRKLLVGVAITVAWAVLPDVIERPKVDRFFALLEVGEEKAESRKQKAEIETGTSKAESGKRKAETETGTSKAESGKRKAESNDGRSKAESGKQKPEIGTQHSALNTHRGFTTRSMYGLRSETAKYWGQRNGLTEPVAFSHNLNHIFPPSEYLWHPEFFPLVEGERLQPPRGSYFWQPDLGREDVAAWAAEAARSHFQAHPDAVSFAVGVNDGLIFGESEETLALLKSRKQKAEIRNPELKIDWFRQRPDFTDLVYTFTNRVAREVAATHPDKYVGALAYYWCENAPSFPLEPNVIPFLTADRSQGYDERFREEERELQRKWARALAAEPHGEAVKQSDRETVHAGTATESRPHRVTASRAPTAFNAPTFAGPSAGRQHSTLNSADAPLKRRIGLYDYLYGSGFLIPRVHTRLIADNLRQARRLGFTDYFAELNPNWGLDGPMAWLVAQLLQDPEQSREVMLEEYYSRYFREAAVPMRRFFERCEYQWMTQPGPAYWLKHYRNESQAQLFPSAVCRDLRVLLDEAARQARDEITKKRVAFVSDTFGVTERFVEFCESRDVLNRAVLRAARAERPELRGERQMRTKRVAHESREQAQGLEKAESRKLKAETGATDHTDGYGSALNHQLSALNDRFEESRAEFVTYTMTLMEREPEALAPFVWADYLRHEPPLLRSDEWRKADGARQRGDGRAAGAARSEAEGAASGRPLGQQAAQSGKQKADPSGEAVPPSPEAELRRAGKRSSGRADLVAKAMATVVADTDASQPQAFNLPASRRVKPFTEFRDLTAGPIVPAWTIGGLRYGVALPEGWQSYVEPSEFQSAELRDGVLRLEGNKETFVYQWLPVSGDAAYRAGVSVRGHVEPSTTVILALSWLDAGQRRLGSTVHRLPEGEWPEWVTLEAEDTAPAGAAWVGIGLRVQNQMGAEWVEAKEVRLEKLKAEN